MAVSKYLATIEVAYLAWSTEMEWYSVEKFLGFAHWFMSIRISQLKDHSISVDQARYATSIVSKYLDTATVKVSNNCYKTKLPADMIFTKEGVSTSDDQVESLTREYNIHYRACIGSLIYLLSTRVDLSFPTCVLQNLSPLL